MVSSHAVDGAGSIIMDIYNKILRQCGDAPKTITVPESLFYMLYLEFTQSHATYSTEKPRCYSFKIVMTGPDGTFEVRPE